ncbi:uncharacterized protein LAESUDRAFT_347141 [Laetiporus sulphureus 93-53]|uniref:Uncharacterized protein n=1 Tax=Laetiporus sulphureus 93-53 TaxID=1314785 RepID=A0A165GSF0_9APHY|nr:uncharacterized protein LAESUDRAFT_347141 [Laetiporus sulphureus 93-53]KZT10744.1 hypothetical protein LAESUDRAFT_347141 [Laetiporus sulphureus 93-53]
MRRRERTGDRQDGLGGRRVASCLRENNEVLFWQLCASRAISRCFFPCTIPSSLIIRQSFALPLVTGPRACIACGIASAAAPQTLAQPRHPFAREEALQVDQKQMHGPARSARAAAIRTTQGYRTPPMPPACHVCHGYRERGRCTSRSMTVIRRSAASALGDNPEPATRNRPSSADSVLAPSAAMHLGSSAA